MISFTLDKFSKMSQRDEVSLYVQANGGRYEIHGATVVEFYVPKENFEFTILKYPFLQVIDYVW